MWQIRIDRSTEDYNSIFGFRHVFGRHPYEFCPKRPLSRLRVFCTFPQSFQVNACILPNSLFTVFINSRLSSFPASVTKSFNNPKNSHPIQSSDHSLIEHTRTSKNAFFAVSNQWPTPKWSGAQIFQKSRSYLKVLGAGRVTSSRFHIQNPQILGATLRNVVARVTCGLVSVPPYPNKCSLTCTIANMHGSQGW
jgi:hypothetical protein